ncbi:MAG: hypothetical protein PHW73_07275 [Atribacterota bacterium]|nr:hypothetical protein [Atribacterota bacterium]
MSIKEDLLVKDSSKLFKSAREIGALKNIKFSFTNIISSECRIIPLCRHCEWMSNQHFYDNKGKRRQKEDFIKEGLRAEKIGINRIVVPSGWMGYNLPDIFLEYLEELIRNINLPVWGAFGAVSKESLQNLKEIGLKGYDCGIETTNQKAFNYMRPGDDFDKRIETLKNAKELGLFIGTSLVIGVGETIGDVIRGIKLMKKLKVDFAALWPFCPSPYTEMESWDIPNSLFVAKILAVMVLNLKNTNITADTRPKNLKWGIRAGANAFGVPDKTTLEKITKMRETLIKNNEI